MRSFGVSYGRGDYRLHLEEVSPFWRGMAWLANRVCVLTRHRWCHLICGPVDTREYRSTKSLMVLPLTQEQARVFSPELVELFEDDDDDE